MLSPLLGYILRGVYQLQVAVITIFGLLSIVIFCLLFLYKGKKSMKTPQYLLFGFILAFYYLVWGIFNGQLKEDGPAKFFLANSYLLVLFILILIENISFSESFIKNIIRLLKLTIISSFGVSVYQLLVDPFFFTPENVSKEIFRLSTLGKYELRIQSIYSFLDQNDLGLSFIPLFSVFVGYHLKSNKQNIFFIAFIIMAGLVCFLSNGRYIMLNYLFIFGQLYFLNQMKFSTKLKYIFGFILVFIFILIGLIYVGYNLKDFYEERIMSDSADSRILAFEMLGRFFLENPIFGTGVRHADSLDVELAGRSSQIHVGYLSVLYEYGLFGAIVIFGFWFKIAKHFYQKAKKSSYFGSFFGFLSFTVANLVLVQYSIFFYGLIFCFIFCKYYYNASGYDNQKSLISI